MEQNGVSNVEYGYFLRGHWDSMECEANLGIMAFACKYL